MSARIGDLAIARFDDGNEYVCFVIGRDRSQTIFTVWTRNGNGANLVSGRLPKNRVIRAVVKRESEHFCLNGEITKLTMNDVEPYTIELARTKTTTEKESPLDFKLGGCYHNGAAYCLGYRAHNNEIELDGEIFTNLNTGVGTRADTALAEHRQDFDPRNDVPRFIVALKPVRIIEESDPHDDTNDCDCGKDCDCDCSFCGESGCDWDCLEDNYCETCGGTCEDECDDEDEYENTCRDCGCMHENCQCDEHLFDECAYENCNCTCREDCLDDENVDKTFRPMNAFARARWLKARSH